MKRRWLLLSPVIAVAVLPLLAPAQRPAAVPATSPATTEVFFSPHGGCTDTIVRELGTAKYDWTGIVAVMLMGIYLGWVRLQTGSTILTMILHAVASAVATAECAVAVELMGRS